MTTLLSQSAIHGDVLDDANKVLNVVLSLCKEADAYKIRSYEYSMKVITIKKRFVLKGMLPKVYFTNH